MGKFIDLTGQRFGRLVVISLVYKDMTSQSFWVSRCDCGVEKIVSRNNLRRGNTQSCGCYKKEIARQIRFKDLEGLVFGKLRVINLSHRTENGSYYWLCKCDCGNEKIIDGHSLKR